MNKLIFPALMLTIPIFSSINLIACDNRKIYEKIIKKNPGSFIIKKISQEELPNKNIFNIEQVLFDIGKLNDLKSKKYDENKYLFTRFYRSKDEKTNEYIYGIMLIPISLFEKYKAFNEKTKNELLNTYSLKNMEKTERNYLNVTRYWRSADKRKKAVYLTGGLGYLRDDKLRWLFNANFSFELFFDKTKSSIFKIKWYYGENIETKILLEYKPS